MPSDLLPGFRFHPKDEELIYYLTSKDCGSNEEKLVIFSELNICDCEPWDLPQKGLLTGRDQDVYFFNRRQMRYRKGERIKRSTKAGHWKGTGKEPTKIMSSNNRLIGTKKTFVFHKGRVRQGSPTEWHMDEYLLVKEESGASDSSQVLELLFWLRVNFL